MARGLPGPGAGVLRLSRMSSVPPASTGIPAPIDGDDDDVAWALQTAAVEWKRGAQTDAIAWLRAGAGPGTSMAVRGTTWRRCGDQAALRSSAE